MILRTLPRLAAAFTLASLGCHLHAASITVLNHSFEDTVLSPGTFATTSSPAGWSPYGSIDFSGRVIGALNPASTTLYSAAVPDGANVGVIFLLDGGPAVESGMTQTLGATLQLNTTYTLQIEVGNIANDPFEPHSDFNFSGFPGYRIDLLAGGTVIASDNNSLLPAEGQFLTSNVLLSVGGSHAQAGQSLAIRLVNLDGNNGIEVNFDNVRLDASPIPEPAHATLAAGASLLVLAALSRRRRLSALA